MRTTVTIDPDVAQALQARARERDLTFKEVLNSTLRAGLAEGRQATKPYRVPRRSLGLRPGIDLDKALQLAAALEDDELLRRLEERR